MERCPECGSWEACCSSEEPVKGCGCTRCICAEVEQLRQQRDELVAALKEIPNCIYWEDARALVFAALAKIEGSAK